MNDRKNNEKRIVVSMTSYPARIECVSTAIESILDQTMKPDLIILWLAEEEFPDKEKQLPSSLKRMIRDNQIILRWCDDLKPHKKYFYAFSEFSHDLIITVDDDLVYSSDMVEKLYTSYKKHPDCVSALRAHLMVYDENTGIAPYETWMKEYDGAVGIPSMQLFCTCGAGSLFPAELFHRDLLDQKAITENCLYADDVWLKLMEVVCGIPVVLVDQHTKLNVISGTQDNSLYSRNCFENDKQLKDSIHWFEERYGQGLVLTKLLNIPDNQKLLSVVTLSEYYNKKIDELSAPYKERIDELVQINKNIRKSKSYIIGRVITWPIRKAKSLTRRTQKK